MVSDTRSTRESTRQATESPLSVRKSKGLENETPPLTPPAKRTAKGLGKCKKELSSRSVSKESTEDALSKSKEKKEKTVIQVTMESNTAELDPEVVGMKRKNLNAREFQALFKTQKVATDGGDELERSENLVGVCSDNGNGINSQGVEDTEDVGDDCSKRVVGKLRDKSIFKVSEGALPDSALRNYQADVENGISVDSCIRDYVVDDPGSKYATYSSPNEDKDSESSQEGSTSGNCSKRSKYYKVAEDTASASLVCGYRDLEGTCLLCSKIKRVRYDLPEQELCSCCPMGEDLVGIADSSTNDDEVLCGSCKKDGDLLTCEGQNCRNCYHLSCLDPPLTDALPGAWHCPQCVKKKILLGVHSVSTGVESIWDIREVVVPNAEGVQQRQFLVKYHGLAHVHNHWVPESQLLLETPCLVSDFLEKDQDARWNAKWMVPHRLLWKRPIQDIIYVASTSVIWVCEYEWLVKWRDLDYDHATWELDNAKFLSSSVGQDLVRNYEVCRGKAKSEANKPHMEPIIRHSEIPGVSHETHALENVNKVRKFLLKCPNAVVIDDQEQMTTAINLIHSMIETFRSFLIVATHDSLSRWEANFERLAPSVNVVVYSGSIDTRNMIRVSEFYDEGGCMTVQVLLSSVEVVLEDLVILKRIKWKAILIDEDQYSGIPKGLEQIKMLSTDMRVLLVSSQIKDATSEYLKILSFVEPQGDFDKLRSLQSETNDNLSKLKERLSPFIVHVQTSQAPKFIEYWVPVQISNLQLEHYCATLLSHSNALCSCLRKDPFCVLPEALLTVRKCCHHPYLVDSSVQACLIADKHPTHVVKDVGIKASGKLQLLDVMLSEIKTRGLRVLILYQLIRSGQLSSGSILSDLLFHRFGSDKYEHVDAACIKSEKQAAADRFNEKTTGQFVFLLDNRACSSCIKLSSLDIVVIYDSDWNPANDLRALKKISIDSKAEVIKVFRLYSSFTIEERALLLARQKLNLDHSSSNFSRSTCNTLMSWGATYLFNKLDEYHADRNCSLALNLSGQLLLDKVTKEFQAILSENSKNADSNSVISEAKSDVGSYCTNTLVFGESKVQLKDGEEHHVFWKNLFEAKNPQWKHLMGPSPRNRKKVHYWEGSGDISEAEKDNLAKKRQKMVNESLGPGSYQVKLSANKVSQVIVSNKGPSAIKSCHQSESFHRDGQSSLDEFSVSVASKEKIVPSDEQRSAHCALQRGMKTLCQHLNLPDNVIQVAEKFLEYVIRNHHVNSNSTSSVQALQISLCWVAASITDQKVDKKESLKLAKQHLGYQCTEEEVSSVYTKMLSLKKVYLADLEKKKVYLECSDNGTCLNRDGLSGEEDFSRGPSNVNNGELQCSANKEHVEGQILTQQKAARNDEAGANDIDEDDAMKIVQKKCDKRMQKLIQKQQKQIEEVERIWMDGRDKLETNHKLESSRIRSTHGQTPAGMDKLKLLDVDLNNKIKDLDIFKDAQLKNLRADHFVAINEERQRVTHWLTKTKSRSRELSIFNGHQSLSTLPADDAGSPQPSTCIVVGGDGDKFPIPGNLENENPNMSFSQQGNGVISSISLESALADARSDETPAENLVSCTSGNEVGVESLAELTQSENFIDNGLAVLTKLPTTAEQVSDENQWVKSTEEHSLVHETVPNDIVGHDPSQEESNDVRETSLSDDLVCRRSEPVVVTGSCVHSPGQPSLQTEQTMTLPDSYEMLPQDTDALHEENRSAPQIEIAMSEPTDSVTPVPLNFESLVTDDIVSLEASDKAPVELQDTDAPCEENRSAPQIEIAMSEPTDSVTPVPLNFESPVTDDIVTPEASDKAPVDLQDTDALHEENRSAPQIEIAMSEPTDSVTPVPLNFESPVTDDIVTPEASDKAPVELQDTDALHEENRSAPQIEIAMSKPTDSVTPVPLNCESPVTDDIVSPEASDKAPVDEVFGQLHPLAVDISLSHDQLLATEHHDQERSSPQTAEPEGTEVVLHRSISQADENLELHAHRMSVVAGTSNQPNQAVMENGVAVPQAMVSTSGQPNQAVLNPPVVCLDVGNLHGPNFFLNPTHQPIRSSALPSLTDPLQNEIERIDKETEQLEKSHADMMAQLKSDCDKEIEKIIAQLRNKYEMKSRETDAEIRVKMHELDKNQNKVCLSIMLANAFRSKCSDARPSGLPSIQQGISNPMLPPSVRPAPGPSASQPAPSPSSATAAARTLPTTSSSVQQLSRSHLMRSSPSPGPSASQPAPSPTSAAAAARTLPTTSSSVQQLSRSHLMRSSPSPGPSASQPAPSPTSAPAAAHTLPTTSSAVQQLSQSHLMRSSPSAIRNVTAHPIQGLQRAAARISGNSARPPVISAITPANLRASSEIRSVLPHLRSCRSIVGASMSAPPSSSSASQLQPIQILPKPPSQPGLLPRPPLVAQNIPPGFPDRQPYLSENRNASEHDIPSTFRSLEQSDSERLGNTSLRPVVQVEAGVVCLSDDE